MSESPSRAVAGTVRRYDEGPVAVLEMSRPGRRNADGPDMRASLLAVLAEVSVDETVNACLLTGADGTFSSGADIGRSGAHQVNSVGARAAARPASRNYFSSVVVFPKPVVAAVDGYAIGAGFLLALCADIIYCSPAVQFGLPQAQLGILAASGGIARLAQRIGKGRAAEIALTSRRVSGDEAYRIGLTDALVPSADLHDAALRKARELARLPPLAARFAKESLNQSYEDTRIGHLAEIDLHKQMMLMATDDAREAHAAWRERRPHQGYRNR